MTRSAKLKAEEGLPISEHGYTIAKLLDGTVCPLLLDIRTCLSFMSKHTLSEEQVLTIKDTKMCL